METLFRFLETISPLTDALKQHLANIVKVRELAKKEYLLKAKHVCHSIGFIEKGLLRGFYNKGNVEISSFFMKEGDVVFSSESFYLQKESYQSIQALEDSIIYYIEYTELQYLYKTFPEFNFIGRVLTEKYYLLWTRQLDALRMQQAQEKYQWLLDNHPDLLLRVPAKYLASYLGMSEVMLSYVKGKK